MVEKPTLMAMKEPGGPSPAECERTQASGSSRIHRLTRLINVGVRASPAQLNAAVSTIPYP